MVFKLILMMIWYASFLEKKKSGKQFPLRLSQCLTNLAQNSFLFQLLRFHPSIIISLVLHLDGLPDYRRIWKVFHVREGFDFWCSFRLFPF